MIVMIVVSKTYKGSDAINTIYFSAKKLIRLCQENFTDGSDTQTIQMVSISTQYQKKFIGKITKDEWEEHKSKFAFSKEILSKIKGETRMGWTGFIVKMNDSKLFNFGTSFLFHYFQMPEGYEQSDINEIINHSYVLNSGEIRSYRDSNKDEMEELKTIKIYREKPYFECYVDSL